MKGKKLLCIVLSLAAVCSLFLIRDSVAWFDTDTGSPATGTIRVDKMAFSFDGSLGSYLQYTSGSHNGEKYLVTEQNLIVTNGGRITVTNYSTILTEARFHITYDAVNPSTHQKETRTYTAAATDSLSVSLDSHWIQDGNTGYFEYYSVLPDPEGETAEEISGTKGFAPVAANAETFTPVDAINKIMYLDELFVNGSDVLQKSDYFSTSGGVTTPFGGAVHVVFEAKQADHVTWTQINSWSTLS